MIANHKQLIEKYKRQIAFKTAQKDFVAVELLEQRIEKIELRKKEKAEREHYIKTLSDPPKHSHIHRVSDLEKCIKSIVEQKPDCADPDKVNKLALNVWIKQNPDLGEYYTSFLDFAEALVQGYYVPFQEIIDMHSKLYKK